MARFNEDQRDAIYRLAKENKSTKEIAKALDLKYQIVRSALKSKWLKERLESEEKEQSIKLEKPETSTVSVPRNIAISKEDTETPTPAVVDLTKPFVNPDDLYDSFDPIEDEDIREAVRDLEEEIGMLNLDEDGNEFPFPDVDRMVKESLFTLD